MKHLTEVIVSPSEIITDGLKTSLTKIKGNNLSIISISRQDDIERIFSLKPSLVIADPLMVTLDTVENLRQAGKTQIVALTAVNLPETVSHAYDTVMTLYEPTGWQKSSQRYRPTTTTTMATPSSAAASAR